MIGSTRRALVRRRVSFIGAALVALALYLWGDLILRTYVVPTSSMEPTLQCDSRYRGCSGNTADRLLVLPVLYRVREPRRGDIAVFAAPSRATEVCASGKLVKRIVGVPGDVIVVDARGARLADSPVDPDHTSVPRRTVVLGPRQYFLVGDNRTASCDSRQWGSVSRDDLVGPALARYWPLDRRPALTRLSRESDSRDCPRRLLTRQSAAPTSPSPPHPVSS